MMNFADPSRAALRADPLAHPILRTKEISSLYSHRQTRQPTPLVTLRTVSAPAPTTPATPATSARCPERFHPRSRDWYRGRFCPPPREIAGRDGRRETRSATPWPGPLARLGVPHRVAPSSATESP